MNTEFQISHGNEKRSWQLKVPKNYSQTGLLSRLTCIAMERTLYRCSNIPICQEQILMLISVEHARNIGKICK